MSLPHSVSCLTSSGIPFLQYNLALKKYPSQPTLGSVNTLCTHTQDSILRLVGLALHMPRGDTFLPCMSPAFPAQSNKIKHLKIIHITVSWKILPDHMVSHAEDKNLQSHTKFTLESDAVYSNK
jgi:hypothetical protein